MPIYAYRCTSCGHAKDVLQKVSDPLLTECPACGAATFTKQLTAAGFQLKGSGWYVTDFRGGNTAAGKEEGEAGDKAPEKAADKAADKTSDAAGPDMAAAAPPSSAPGPAAAAQTPSASPASPAPAAPAPSTASPPASGG